MKRKGLEAFAQLPIEINIKIGASSDAIKDDTNSFEGILDLSTFESQDIEQRASAYRIMLNALGDYKFEHRTERPKYHFEFKGEEREVLEFYAIAKKWKNEFENENRDCVLDRSIFAKKISGFFGVIGGIAATLAFYDNATEIAINITEKINNFSSYFAPLTGLAQTVFSLVPTILGSIVGFTGSKKLFKGYAAGGQTIQDKINTNHNLLYNLEVGVNKWKLEQIKDA